MTVGRIVYGGGSIVEVDAPLGHLLELEPSKPTEVIWATRDRRVVTVELQVMLESLGGASVADLKWQVYSHAHGGSSYQYPPFTTSSAIGPISRLPGWRIPARGLRERIAARELRVMFASTAAAGTVAPKVRVSMQPVDGADVPIFPRTDISNSGSGPASFFPAGAREWRLATVNGEPSDQLLIWGFDNVVVETTVVSNFDDWTPIRLDGYRWTSSSQDVAVYR